MTFNPLKEKGIALDKQLRCWHDIVKRPFDKHKIDCYSRTRQILMNGIEVEAWGFKHSFARFCDDLELVKLLAEIRRIEDTQQTTVNWMTPAEQSVLETTLGYEQVAVDLTAWLAQNEPDDYVRETLNFGLLEDFDHLYRYAQWAYMIHGINPNNILHEQTDVLIGRPTQNHHNDNKIRVRNHYDKNTASPQTKVNILTVLSGEQQTHNFYAEHGMMYGNDDVRRLYGEICDVEEEHVSMYESLIDPTETMFEKLLLHEFTEACTYYNCYKDEQDDQLKLIWEEFLAFELEHLKIAADLIKKHEKRDPEEIIGDTILEPCHFENQKEYVADILLNGEDNNGYEFIENLPDDWASYKTQKIMSSQGAPSEKAIQLIRTSIGRDLVYADNKLAKKQPDLLAKGLEDIAQAPDTVPVETYQEMQDIKMIDL